MAFTRAGLALLTALERNNDRAWFAERAADAIEARILEVGPQNVAAFIGEPVQGAGGVVIPPDGQVPTAANTQIPGAPAATPAATPVSAPAAGAPAATPLAMPGATPATPPAAPRKK